MTIEGCIIFLVDFGTDFFLTAARKFFSWVDQGLIYSDIIIIKQSESEDQETVILSAD